MEEIPYLTKLIIAACITGFVGDFILQQVVKSDVVNDSGWGLKEYFKTHGKTESMFIAAGMLVVFYSIYIVLRIPITYTNMILYGVILDFIFRKANIFPSLGLYYFHMDYFWSAVWGAIPMIIPLLLVGVGQ